MTPIERFIAFNVPQTSKLNKHKNEILELRNRGVSLRLIAKYLKDTHNLNVCFQTVGDFIKKQNSIQEIVTPTARSPNVEKPKIEIRKRENEDEWQPKISENGALGRMQKYLKKDQN